MAVVYESFATAFMMIILASALSPAFSVQAEPEIVFDKTVYGPFDLVTAVIKYQKPNSDLGKIETLSAQLLTGSMLRMHEPAQELSFTEAAANSDIFVAHMRLTPDPSMWPGNTTVRSGDELIVEFKTPEGMFTSRAHVDFYTSSVIFTQPTYKVTDTARIIVIDPDENRHPDTIDTLPVRVWSTTDRGGLLVTLRETGASTGIFTEFITFTTNEESAGTRLRVSEGDTITVKYIDKTLPPPVALSANGVDTVEVQELFASATIVPSVLPLERAIVSEPEIVGSHGEMVNRISLNQQVLIQSEINNNETRNQPFAYIVQVKDKDGVTISLSWVTGSLPGRESLKAAQSWIPDAAGDYTIEVFVWESVDKPTALSPERTTTVTVTAEGV